MERSTHPRQVFMLQLPAAHARAKPKSQSLMRAGCESSSSVLSNFRSRCATLCVWQYATARMNCCVGSQRVFQS